MKKMKPKTIAISYFKKHLWLNSNEFEYLIDKGDIIISRYFNSPLKKPLADMPTIDINYMMLYFEYNLTTEKGNWSKKKVADMVKRKPFESWYFNSVFYELCKEFCRRHKNRKGKSALNFAGKLTKGEYYKWERYREDVKIKVDVEIREVLEASKPLKELLNCSTEDFIEILFGDGRIASDYTKSTLRNYFFD